MTEPKTVTVRIAVAIDPHGGWNAVGTNAIDDDDAMSLAMMDLPVCTAYWVTVTVPVPEAQEIAGKVEAAE